MERVKLVAVSGFVYSRKAVDAGESFEATPVDADYLVGTGQATREEARGNTYSRRDMVAASPRAATTASITPGEVDQKVGGRAPTQSHGEAGESALSATPPERVKRTYTRRNLTAEGTAEGTEE